MNNVQFFQELEQLQKEGSNLIPTEKFCKKFQRRLPTEKQIPEEYLGRDAEDYHAWGKALFDDIHIDGEGAMNDLNLWEWIAFYEALEAKDFDKILEAAKELFKLIEYEGDENMRSL